MITITAVPTGADPQDFYRSLSASHSGEHSYEVVSDSLYAKHRVKEPSGDSRINIYLPDNCLVLGNSWDKYMMHALENGLPKYNLGKDRITWIDYVIRRFGLVDKTHVGLFPEIKVETISSDEKVVATP